MRRFTSASVLAIALPLVAACSSSSSPATPATGAGGAATTSTGGTGGAGGHGGAGGGASGPDRTLVLLFTSDEHSHLVGFAPEIDDHPAATEPGSGGLKGGVARRAAVLAREREAAKKAGKATLTVSAGDNHMGALPHVAFAHSSLDYASLVALGYDVTTIGNHELDFGTKALADDLDAAKAGKGAPPIVASNIHFSPDAADDDALAAHYSADVSDAAMIHPYRVVTTDSGLRVGFAGIVGVEAASDARNRGSLRFSEGDTDPKKTDDKTIVLPKLYADLQPVVDTLRTKEKVDLVVLLSHSGVYDSSTPEGQQAGEDWQIAENVSGIDVVVSGHMHNHDPKPMVVTNKASGREVLVLNAGAFGQEVGRVELTVHGDASKPPSWDPATQALLPVDEATVPDPTIAADVDAAIGAVEGDVEGAPFLEGLLSRATGAPVKDDPKVNGDLYFFPVSSIAYDIVDRHPKCELSADATLTMADTLGLASDVAVESAAIVRAPLKQGRTGVVSAADAFAVLPLGTASDDSPGYPLVRVWLSGVEIRGIAEASLSARGVTDRYDLGWSGMRVEYDATRPFVKSSLDLFSDKKGQVMKIALDTNHADGLDQYDTVIFDRAAGIAKNNDLFSVVASSYIGTFAADVGVSPKDANGKPLAQKDALLTYPDGKEVKQLDAFFGFLWKHKDKGLPDVYDAKSPNLTKRLVCVKGC
jgi:5'-nucleotidase